MTSIDNRSGGKPQRRSRLNLTQVENRVAYAFLAPWFVGLVLITMGPVLVSLYLSFTDFDVLSSPQWVGGQNYIEMFTDDPTYWASVDATFKFVGWSVPLILIFSLAVAAALNRGLSGLALYRSLFYVPSLIGSSVAIGFLWLQVFGTRGLLNDVLAVFGIEGIIWVSRPDTAPMTVITLNVWTFGASMVIFLAALRQIPASLYEAASIDGANAWQKFRRITLPLLTPVIFFNLIIVTINSFQAFTQAWVISRGTGGPLNSLMLYTVYLYKTAFQQLNMGYAAAMAWILLAAIAAFTAFFFWTSRYWVFYGD